MPYYSNTTELGDITSVIATDASYEAESLSRDLCVVPENSINNTDDDGISAEGAILVDIDNNNMIYSKNIYERLYPASLTKLATALVCLEYGDLYDTVTVSYKAANMNIPGAKLCYLREGDKINFKVLLTSFLCYSGNDAGIALAEHIAGTENEFVVLVNDELRRIGAVDSHFTNSHGLHDDEHYTTVYDMYLIVNELLKYDVFEEISSLKSYTAKFEDGSGNPIKKIYENTDRFLIGEKDLIKGFKITGSKTGTTLKAGYCLALVTKSKKGRYISIIMKARISDVLYDEMNTLLKMAKKNKTGS